MTRRKFINFPSYLYIHSIYNNENFAINFTKLLLCHIICIFSYFLVFNFCNFYFIQPLIFFNHCILILYIFLNSTISLYSTFYLLQPFFFYLNFHINFLLLPFHLSPIPSKLSMTKKIILSLSLFDFVSLLVDFLLLQPLFFFY